MENNKPAVNRSKEANSTIYRYFEEEELSNLTDDEFRVLKTKMCSGYTTSYTAPLYGKFFEDFIEKAKEDNNLDFCIYKRKLAADDSIFACYDRYARIFSLCRALGITNVYDIGCGPNLQAFLLIHAPEMYYTGIDDRFISYFEDFEPTTEYLNKLFEDFLDNDRIKFIKDEYPCELSVKSNNIAISIGALGVREAMKALSNGCEHKEITALSNDFERIIIDLPTKKFDADGISAKEIVQKDIDVWTDPYDEYYELLKKAMPDYYFIKIGDSLNYVFGTRIKEDKEILEKKYKIIDNCLMTGFLNTAWAKELLIPFIYD